MSGKIKKQNNTKGSLVGKTGTCPHKKGLKKPLFSGEKSVSGQGVEKNWKKPCWRGMRRVLGFYGRDGKEGDIVPRQETPIR